MSLRIAELPEKERPRERLDRLGLPALTDAELLALILRSGAAGTSAVDLGQELIAEAGGLAELASAKTEELAGRHAMGPAKASAVAAAFELGRRVDWAQKDTPRLVRGPEDIVTVTREHLRDPTREEALVVVLSASNRVIRVERMTVGTRDRCLLDPGDVLATVLKHGGRAFAVVHTHPSGNTDPSPEDIDLTRRLQAAAEVTGIRFIDHVIMAGRRWATLHLAT